MRTINYLSSFNLTIELANQWVLENISNPHLIYQTAIDLGVDSEMLADIVSLTVSNIDYLVVENFFDAYGLEGGLLRRSDYSEPDDTVVIVPNEPFDLPHTGVDLKGNNFDWVNDAENLPYSAVGYIRSYFESEDTFYTGSGVMITPVHVLTNAHVVMNQGVLSESVLFYPGHNGENMSMANHIDSVHLYAQSNVDFMGNFWPDNDIALVTLSEPVGNQTGYASLYASYEDELTGEGVFWAGYPKGNIVQDNPETAWSDVYFWQSFGEIVDYSNSAYFDPVDNSSLYGGDGQLWLSAAMEAEPGASGSPVFYNSNEGLKVVGVYSGAWDATPVAATIDSDTYAWIENIVQNDGYLLA